MRKRSPGYKVTILLLLVSALIGWHIYRQLTALPGQMTAGHPSDLVEVAVPDLPPEPRFSMAPIGEFEGIVERPLFSPSRRPPPVEETEASVEIKEADIVLIGVVIDDHERVALFRSVEEKRNLRLGEGDSVEGWTLVRIQADRVVLEAYGIQLTFEPGTEPTMTELGDASDLGSREREAPIPHTASEESIPATRTAALAQSTASAPPEGVDATAVMTLDQLFSLNEVSDDGSVALAQLFGLWHHDYGALAGRDVCAKARLGGLRCLRGKSSVKALATLNRPAVLHFTSPGGIQFPAVLTALEGSWMTFTMGEHLVRASSKEVAAAWNGEYLLLWRPPAGYQRALRRGSKGAAVAWLRDRLAELANEPAPAAAEKTFDAALEAQVIAFQRNHLLLNDGIAGPRTLIQLQNTLGDQDVVLLAANP